MLGGLEPLRDCHYVQDGLEKSEEGPIRVAKVLLSSCSLESSVANESARDVFERTIKAATSHKRKSETVVSQVVGSIVAVTPWRERYWFGDKHEKSGKPNSVTECFNVCASKNESEIRMG